MPPNWGGGTQKTCGGKSRPGGGGGGPGEGSWVSPGTAGWEPWERGALLRASTVGGERGPRGWQGAQWHRLGRQRGEMPTKKKLYSISNDRVRKGKGAAPGASAAPGLLPCCQRSVASGPGSAAGPGARGRLATPQGAPRGPGDKTGPRDSSGVSGGRPAYRRDEGPGRAQLTFFIFSCVSS